MERLRIDTSLWKGVFRCTLTITMLMLFQFGLHSENNTEIECTVESLRFSPDDTFDAIGFGNFLCLENATMPDDGQFTTTLEISGLEGVVWYLDVADGIYDPATSTDGNPVPFTIGNPDVVAGAITFTENDVADSDTSIYVLSILLVDEEEHIIRVHSDFGDLAVITGQAPSYHNLPISGTISSCVGSTEIYSVDELAGASYSWSINPLAGGTILGDDKAAEIEVQWSATPGTYELTMEPTLGGSCLEPSVYQVTIGVANGYFACRAFMNVSLGEDCEVTIEPGDVMSSPIIPDVPYAVMLTDENGDVIPNATVGVEHVGQTIEAKIFDGCGGNSCWGELTIEDKRKPEFLCEDVTISCYKLDQYEGPIVTDNCGGRVDKFMVGQTSQNADCDFEEFVKIINQKWIAIDQFGNVSDTCPVTIYVERIDTSLIEFPENLTKAGGTALQCNDFPTDERGHPDPLFTGVPTIEGIPMYPSFVDMCNIFVEYTDRDAGQIGCVRKIMRTWKIYEWNCMEPLDTSMTQVIEIADTIPPELTPIDDMTISASSGNCEANAIFPPVQADDNCDGMNVDVDIVYPGGSIENNNGGNDLLPFGENLIKYYVADQCGNLDSLEYTITVIDKTRPTMVCDEKTTVGLDNSGVAYAFAENFDAGSEDACGIEGFLIRRMDLGLPCTGVEDATFMEYAEFCCADAGNTLMLELQATDLAGNTNTCMIEIEVQDKFPPTLTAPGDVTVDCSDHVDFSDLSQFGSATVVDQCGAGPVTETMMDSVNSCGVGYIIRKFSVSDANGTAMDEQMITIQNTTSFNVNGSDIDWPEDYSSDELCGDADVDPENLPVDSQEPQYTEGFCDQVTHTYKDEFYSFNGQDNACFKIVRRWTVIDWCQKERNGDPKTWIYDQVIKISNTIDPVINESCDEVSAPSVDCDGGMITLSKSATDDCTPDADMTWSYVIDPGNDGVGMTIEDSGSGNSVSITDMFPIGTHSILWSFFDKCGNMESCLQLFTIRDENGPKAVGLDGLAIALTPWADTEKACIIADSLDASSYHPCDVPFTFSFSQDTTDKELCFDCFDLGLNEIELWVTDIFGNTDVVIVTIDVQDNNDVDICKDPRDCIEFPDDVTVSACDPDLDPSGGLTGDVVIDPDCICDDYTITFENDTIMNYPNESCIFIRRTHTVTFNCGRQPIVGSNTQDIFLLNATRPHIMCPSDITVAGGDDCMAMVTLDPATAEGSCNSGITITNSANAGGADASGSYPVGTTIIEFIAMDACGNADTCEVSVTVTDGEDPTCNIDDFTVSITDASAGATVTLMDLNYSSADACGMVVNETPGSFDFDCGDIGTTSEVVVTVTDDSGNMNTCSAMVTVTDDIDPTCTIDDITVSITDAMAGYTATLMELNYSSSDACGMVVSETPGSFDFDCSDVGTTSEVVVTVTDDSGNMNTCSAMVTVEDEVAPTCTIQDITLSITGNSIDIDPSSLMITTADACGEVVDTALSQMTFDCDDTGMTIEVTATVTDDSGNMNTCTADVTVTDDSVPSCITQDITVDLDDMGIATITAADIDNGSTGGCGDEITLEVSPSSFDCSQIGPQTVTLTVMGAINQECDATVTVRDTVPPTVECTDISVNCTADMDMDALGGFTVDDNCAGPFGDTTFTNVVDGTNMCGIGIITRTVNVVDANGVTGTCDQIIEVIGEADPFGMDDITFPPDVLIEGCMADIDTAETGGIRLDTSMYDCAMVTFTFMDNDIVETPPGGVAECLDTIIRTWTVTDECQVTGMPGVGIFTMDQIIVRSDTSAPVLMVPADFTVDAVEGSDEECRMFVDMSGVMATDACGSAIVFTNDGEFADSNMGPDASGEYPPGEYTITITATDVCGNESIDSFTVTVEEGESGLPCIKVFASIRDDGTVTVPASSFGVTTATECYDPSNLEFTFDKDNLDSTSVTFDCDDVGATSPGNLLGLTVVLYAFEDGVLVDSCENTVTVINPQNNCTNMTTVVGGNIFTAFGEDVEDVEVTAKGDLNFTGMTDQDGQYAFPSVSMGIDFTIEPKKEDNIINGVSTLDVILIQRHILGIQAIENPYLLVAADIDNSMSITGIDVLQLRRAVLGVSKEFKNNTSWRMVEAEYAFPEIDDPFVEQWPESYEVVNLDGSMNIDFVALKVGDINGSAEVNSRGSIDTRNLENEYFRYVIRDGEIDIYAMRDIDLSGLQLTLDLDVEIDEVISDLPEWQSSMSHVSDESVSISYGNTRATVIEKDTKIMTLTTIDKASEIKIGEDLDSELYLGNELDVKSISLVEGEDSRIVNVQNRPNPWTSSTDIVFYLPSDDQVVSKVYDATGKVVIRNKEAFSAGNNTITITRDQLDGPGIYYYELVTRSGVISNKMILID